MSANQLIQKKMSFCDQEDGKFGDSKLSFPKQDDSKENGSKTLKDVNFGSILVNENFRASATSLYQSNESNAEIHNKKTFIKKDFIDNLTCCWFTNKNDENLESIEDNQNIQKEPLQRHHLSSWFQNVFCKVQNTTGRSMLDGFKNRYRRSNGDNENYLPPPHETVDDKEASIFVDVNLDNDGKEI